MLILTRNFISFNFKPLLVLIRSPCKGPTQKVGFTKFVKKSFSCQCAKHQKLAYEINTVTTKDVLLFAYENKRFFRLLNIFGLSQCFFWFYLAEFAFHTLRDPSCSEGPEKSWWQKSLYQENRYRNGLTLLFLAIGYVILSGTWLFTIRSVKHLILLKGGENIKIITYTPFFKQRTIQVPLEKMTCSHSRSGVTSFLPIKVKGYWFHFLLDKRGTFTNKQLFDHTAGIKRKWK